MSKMTFTNSYSFVYNAQKRTYKARTRLEGSVMYPNFCERQKQTNFAVGYKINDLKAI